MASKTVRDAVKALVGATLAGLPIYEPNDRRADAPTGPFIAYEFPVSTAEQITFGDPGQNTFRETGVLRFVVAATRGIDRLGNSGLDDAMNASETLRSMFRNLQQGGFRFWEMSPPVEDAGNADGTFYRLTMAVPYWFDFVA